MRTPQIDCARIFECCRAKTILARRLLRLSGALPRPITGKAMFRVARRADRLCHQLICKVSTKSSAILSSASRRPLRGLQCQRSRGVLRCQSDTVVAIVNIRKVSIPSVFTSGGVSSPHLRHQHIVVCHRRRLFAAFRPPPGNDVRSSYLPYPI